MKVGNNEAIGVSRRSAHQIAGLGPSFAEQVTLAQGGNTREQNVAMVLTPTELVVTGTRLRRIPLQDVSVVEADSIVLHDGTRIPWTPFRGDRERSEMFAAIAEAAGVEYAPPTTRSSTAAAGTAGGSDTERLIAAIDSLAGEVKAQRDELAIIRTVVIVICLVTVFLTAALIFGWIKIYPMP